MKMTRDYYSDITAFTVTTTKDDRTEILFFAGDDTVTVAIPTKLASRLYQGLEISLNEPGKQVDLFTIEHFNGLVDKLH